MTALREMNYTVLFSFPFGSDGTKDGLELLKHYHYFPDLVKIIIAEGGLIKRCIGDVDCIKSPNFPGVPIWKLIEWSFWPSPEHPLGPSWTVNPYPYDQPSGRDVFYLGYSIERVCTKVAFVPHAERKHRAFVYAKLKRFFSDSDYAWPGLSFNDFPLQAVGAVRPLTVVDNDPELPGGFHNFGELPREQFVAEIAHSNVLIGIGSPPHSPTPYEALCLGVPFVNPIKSWDRDDPDNRAKWDSQHERLRWVDPPYVYNVRVGDLDGLRAAVEQAIANPIERCVELHLSTEYLALKGNADISIRT